jgi:hypothetical protein
MKKSKSIHTVYDKKENVWKTISAESKKSLKNAKTKDKAMKNSIREAKKRKVEHVIHNKDGKISDRDSYGNDPFPPRDKIH